MKPSYKNIETELQQKRNEVSLLRVTLNQERAVSQAATNQIVELNKKIKHWQDASEGWAKAAHGMSQALEGIHQANMEFPQR